MKTSHVRSASTSYPVICGHGSLARLRSRVDELRDGGEVFVLSSPRVWKFWGRAVMRQLVRVARNRVILFDDREVAKRLATVEGICRELVRARADRQALLVAVGGGVVGDVAGFAAASYLRGVRIAHVPTTVVAQVDSAIGGKTGVDLPEGKNLIGAFYPPQIVLADPSVLRTLPPRQFRSGLYEVIKYGVIGDKELFGFLERKFDALLSLDMPTLEWVIHRCVRAKAQIVSRDERESGLRQILNFGHTIGHALESLTEYKAFLHGEAIGWGMLGATLIAVGLGRLNENDASRIASLIARCGTLPVLPRISSEALLRAIGADKKSRGGRVRWVLPRSVGAAEIGVDVPGKLVAMAWRELPGVFAEARRSLQK
ncbi:MAG TPA: 3-dehydroquinate synthase [Candidatus Acidoferrales bacterium]|nr:3-dehydroquinate synthase [Candidatus Acidoferrales bacterium]